MKRLSKKVLDPSYHVRALNSFAAFILLLSYSDQCNLFTSRFLFHQTISLYLQIRASIQYYLRSYNSLLLTKTNRQKFEFFFQKINENGKKN